MCFLFFYRFYRGRVRFWFGEVGSFLRFFKMFIVGGYLVVSLVVRLRFRCFRYFGVD